MKKHIICLMVIMLILLSSCTRSGVRRTDLIKITNVVSKFLPALIDAELSNQEIILNLSDRLNKDQENTDYIKSVVLKKIKINQQYVTEVEVFINDQNANKLLAKSSLESLRKSQTKILEFNKKLEAYILK